MSHPVHGRILLTAFEPFGIKGALTGRNASATVCERAMLGRSQDVAYRRLPVAADAILRFEHLLSQQPAGVVMTGENLTQITPVAIELAARDPSRQFTALGVAMPGRRSVPSQFARKLAAKLGNGSARPADTIGAYYCNAIYWAALRWSNRTRRPAVFLHISPWRDAGLEAEVVSQVVEAMRGRAL